MFDNLYTQLTEKVNYKVLVLIPIVVSILMIPLFFYPGIPLSIDFRGGTWMEITGMGIDDSGQAELKSNLVSIGLEDVRIYAGKEFDTNKDKLTIVTTSSVNKTEIEPLLSEYMGDMSVLSESDTATIQLNESNNLSISTTILQEKLENRLNMGVDVDFDDDLNLLKISAIDLDEDKLETALEYYLKTDLTITFEEKNLNIKKVGSTLGEKFMSDGIRALAFAYLLMAVVIFFAFRDFIPSIAVILAATCDAIIAAGCMVILGIQLEPASLVALLMLIGYSVDSDILLTARVLKRKTGSVDERINDAMKTGLTMTITTLTVMVVIVIISSVITQIATLTSIASVLVLGLLADITTTWFMNAGILKWYMDEKGGKFMESKRFKKRRLQ